jgi:hypothetical protein
MDLLCRTIVAQPCVICVTGGYGAAGARADPAGSVNTAVGAAICVHGDDDPVPDGEKQRDNADGDPGDRQTAATVTGFGDLAPGDGSEPDPGDGSRSAGCLNRQDR